VQRRAQGPAHDGAAAFPSRFRRRLQGLERRPAADGRIAGCLARRTAKVKSRLRLGQSGPLTGQQHYVERNSLQERWGLPPLLEPGEWGRMKDEFRIRHAGAAITAFCATGLGHLPGVRCTRTLLASASQSFCKGGRWRILPFASAVSPAPYTTLLRTPPDLLQTLSGAMSVPAAVSQLRRQAWHGPLVVHPHRCPPKRPLSQAVARRVAPRHPKVPGPLSRAVNRTLLRLRGGRGGCGGHCAGGHGR
jgi:hypothetical protein